MNCFEISKNESFVWFLLRKEHFLVIKTARDFVRNVNGIIKVATFPKQITEADIVGCNMNDLLSNHSIYPVLKLTSQHYLKRDLIDHVMKRAELTSTTRLPLKSDLMWSEVRFCPDCFIEQIKKYGFCWFLQYWQLQLNTACHFHRKKLIKYKCLCSSHEVTIRNFLTGVFTGECPKCYFNTWARERKRTTKQEIHMSKWFYDFLKHKPIHLSNAVHRSIFYDVLAKNGINDVIKKDQVKSLRGKFFRPYGQLDKPKVINQLNKLTHGAEVPIDPVVFFTLIASTFPSADEFYDYLHKLGDVGFLNIKENDETESWNLFGMVDESLICDNEPFSFNEHWIRLII